MDWVEKVLDQCSALNSSVIPYRSTAPIPPPRPASMMFFSMIVLFESPGTALQIAQRQVFLGLHVLGVEILKADVWIVVKLVAFE